MDGFITALDTMSELMIQMEIDCAGSLDPDRLAQALDHTLDAEPVLGCRFVPDPKHPYWERVEKRPATLQVVDTSDDLDRFRISSIDSGNGCQLQACLHPRSDGDRLLLKVSHEASDAGGLKEISAIVSSIYNELDSNPSYRPEPNFGCRNHKQVMKLVPFKAYPRIFINYFKELFLNILHPATFRLPIETRREATEVEFSVRHLSAEQVSFLSQYGKRFGATINDLFLAALLQSQGNFDEIQPDQRVRIASTVDLRRHYLPDMKGESVCNLSAIVYHKLGCGIGETFEETLQRVQQETIKQKRSWLGLNAYLFTIPLVTCMNYGKAIEGARKAIFDWIDKGRMANAFTNMGPIEAKHVTYGQPARRAWLLPPPGRPPEFLGGLTGYNGTLTLSAGTYPEAMEKITGDGLLDAILDQFPEP